MPFLIKLKNILKADWAIGLGLFFIFLATNGYTYAWDDQHLEIPLLKGLIDPQLYPGDYYVDALKKNFTSFLFPLLAKVITVEQVPSAYFILYLISRFALFFYAYKLWKIITKNKFTAALCVLSFFLVFRVEEFLYRTFSHQEFALGIIMAGMYYFYKNRFDRAAVLLGIAANFHALYSLFPFCYMALYLLWQAREDRAKTLLKSIGLFVLCSAPFTLWTFKRLFLHAPNEPGLYQNWIALYYLACPATFPFDSVPLKDLLQNFSNFIKGTQQFWPVIALFVLNLAHNPSFKKDQKAQAFMIGGGLFIFIAFIFSYIFPSHFILDLNLVRNIQFMQFVLIGYTTVLVFDKVQNGRWETAVLGVILLSLLRFGNEVAAISALAILLLFYEKNGKLGIATWWFFIATLVCIGLEFRHHHFSHAAGITFYATIISAIAFYFLFRALKNDTIKIVFFCLPFLALAVNNIYYHKVRLDVERKAGGFWQLQRNWIDMQNFVRTHTPKNALILTPNDMEMGGFRIFSERRVLVCYRDCGVIGFDYRAALEWQKRLSDVEHFKVMVDGDIKPAMVNAISKYKVNYIVFMRYLNPGNSDFLQPVYENETFSLYRVPVNPL